MMNTVEFQQTIRAASKPASKREKAAALVSEYVAASRKMHESIREIGLGESSLRDARRNLLHAYIKRWLRQYYATLDLSFMKATQPVTLTRDEHSIVTAEWQSMPVTDPAVQIAGKMPVFVQKRLFRGDDAITFDMSVDTFAARRKSPPLRERRVTAMTRCPKGIVKSHERKIIRFTGQVFAAYAAAYCRGVALVSKDERYELPEPRVSVIWAPLPENWSFSVEAPVVKGDPAIVAELFGATYLLDFFDTPDERPIEATIREFSEGSL